MTTRTLFAAFGIFALAILNVAASDTSPVLPPVAAGDHMIQVRGTIARVGNRSITVRSALGLPFEYRFLNSTLWVDEAGTVLSQSDVQTGMAVALEITKAADGLLAKRVVVRQAAPEIAAAPALKPQPEGTSTPVANTSPEPGQTMGTIAEFGENSIAVRTDPIADPVQYGFSESTQWVDHAGNAVARETMRKGQPVTLYYRNGADRRVLSKVVARDEPAQVSVERTELAYAAAAVNPIERPTTTPTLPAPQAALPVAPPVALPSAPQSNTARIAPRTPHQATGILSQFGKGYLAIRADDSGDPVQFRCSDTTIWMDDTGRTVAPSEIRRGATLTLHYITSSQELVILKGVVQNRSDAIVERAEREPVEPRVQNVYTRRRIGVAQTPEPSVIERRYYVADEPAARTVVRRVPMPTVERRKVTGIEGFFDRLTDKRKRSSREDDNDDGRLFTRGFD